jgi:hypothetical protein
LARILLLILIGFALWLLYRAVTKTLRGGSTPPSTSTKSEDMVACSLCGVNMPKSEAQYVDGAYRCAQSETCVHRKKD